MKTEKDDSLKSYDEASENVEDDEELDSKDQNDEEQNSNNDTGIEYSLNKGLKWIKVDSFQERFDIWSVKYNEEEQGMVFFHATSYEELLAAEKIKNQNFIHIII